MSSLHAVMIEVPSVREIYPSWLQLCTLQHNYLTFIDFLIFKHRKAEIAIYFGDEIKHNTRNASLPHPLSSQIHSIYYMDVFNRKKMFPFPSEQVCNSSGKNLKINK